QDKIAMPLNFADFKQRILSTSKADILQEISGNGYYRLLIGKDGKVQDACLIKTPHTLHDMAVSPHLESLLFEPAMRDTVPVLYWFTLRVTFEVER
ncbi:MAG: hypothetical protein AAF570_03265, partial [Bacteroidota bacterium]